MIGFVGGPQPFSILLNIEVEAVIGQRHRIHRLIFPAIFHLDLDGGGVGLEQQGPAGRGDGLQAFSFFTQGEDRRVDTVVVLAGRDIALADQGQFLGIHKFEIQIIAS